MKKDFGNNLDVFVNRANQGYIGQKKFLVDAKWWRKWCDYSSFEVVDNKTQNTD